MGFFKNLFSKKIGLPSDRFNHLAFSYIKSNGKIKLNSKISVNEGWIAFIVSNSKIYDAFTAGEHIISLGSLPIAAKKLNLFRADKAGKLKKHFKSDIIYLNLKEQTKQVLSNTEKIKLHHSKIKNTFTGFKALASYKLSDPKKFLQIILKEYAVLRDNLANKYINEYVSDDITTLIKKSNPTHANFDMKNKTNIEYSFTPIKTEYLKYGVEIISIELKDISKSDHIGEDFFKNNYLENHYENEKLSDEEGLENHIKNEENLTGDEKKELFIKNNIYSKKIDDAPLETKTYDDDDLDNVKYIKCPKCNESLSFNALECYNCGEMLKRKCIACGKILDENIVICPHCDSLNPIE